ncbi:MAG TPA: hypothetical protein VHW43_05695 [Puia sp.]|nr:hypothetical protein [Puia sp.]
MIPTGTATNNLKKLLENLRTMTLWERLFAWKRIKDQLMTAAADLERLDTINNTLQERTETLTHQVDLLDQKKEQLITERNRLAEANAQWRSDDEKRRHEHNEQMATLKQYQDNIFAERNKEINARHQTELDRLEQLKFTWHHHQEHVKQSLKTLCSRHTIDYLDKVPFKGEPDNTVSIGEEFIVFDAKSPRGEDLGNFSHYLREQSEKVKKYAGEERVKNWIFFVVPMNTLEVVKTFVYQLADYHVFVVTIDALEPILLSLKKIEEYEFAEQLSPEERENICRVLGKFAHLSKRRVQIDTYFISQFMELAYKCENDLPPDMLEKAIEFERAEKLSLPQTRRGKAISTADLEKSMSKVRHDAGSKGIALEDTTLTTSLNNIPLYNTPKPPISTPPPGIPITSLP